MNKLYSGLRSNPINQYDNYSNYESVTYTFNGNVISEINKKDPQYTAPTAKEDLVYTGQEQILINAGSTTTGTVKYSSDNINWSTTVPRGINAGTYTLYWKVVGDINHNDTESTTITTSISKATPAYTAPTGNENLEYTGEAQALLNAGSTSDGTIKYSLDGTNWDTSVPTGTEVQTYTVYWKLDGNENHNDVAQATISVEIASAAPTVNFVDLGLPSGKLWADRNVGAESEEGYGAYFSWGNVTGHKSTNGSTFDDSYDWGTVNTGPYASTPGASIQFTSQHKNADYSATSGYDAARKNLGGSWRMPTATEFQELYDNTDNEWTSINGVYGRKFMKKSDHSVYVFFPAAGYSDGTSLGYRGSYSYYWSSSLYSAGHGYHLLFDSSSVLPQNHGNRYRGYSVRAVQDPA